MIKPLLCVFAVAVLAGCAAAEPQVASQDSAVKVAPTGSNMLRKDATLRSHGITSVDRDSMEEARRNTIALPPVGGGPR